MSSSSSHAIVTYTFVSTDNDLLPWGFHLMEADEPEAPDDTEAPPSHVPAPAYLEYLAPFDDEVPLEDQPLPADASPTADSPVYIADSEPIKDDFEEDPKMDHVDYAADEEEEESSNDDDDEEEHLASANSALPVPDFVPSSEETKPFETDEARIYVQPHTPPSPSAEARIAEYASAPTPPLPPPSPLSPLSSPPLLLPPTRPLHTSPTYARALLGYRATMCGDVILEADMPPRKKTFFTAPSHRFEIRESLAATVARQTRSALARGVDYGFIDTLDASIQATGKRVMTALEEVNDRMIDLAATHRYESEEFYTRHQDAQDDRALLQACISTLEREAWAHSEDMSQAMEAQIRALHAKVRVMQRQRIDDGDILTSHIQYEHDRFRELKRTRDVERQDGPADAGSNCVADALADYEAKRGSGNGHDSHGSGSGSGRTPNTTRECTYSDFLKCQPLNFKGTEGVV
ncbi:hypothetical protein Tco_1024301, partial [Tanacetum coccineum]